MLEHGEALARPKMSGAIAYHSEPLPDDTGSEPDGLRITDAKEGASTSLTTPGGRVVGACLKDQSGARIGSHSHAR